VVCSAGTICVDGDCVCNSTSCPDGCCEFRLPEPTCVTPMNNFACGLPGQQCNQCLTGLECSAGICTCTANSCVGDGACCNADLTVCMTCDQTEQCIDRQCVPIGG
jgi:hypothetical protein